MIPIVILAGGLATRLRPATEKIPKSLVLVAGVPFIDHQLRLVRREGFEQVVLCVGHLGEMIEAHVGDGRDYGLAVRYSFDGDRLLGTGGAVRRALPLLGDAFFVLYGDSYLDISYPAVLGAFREIAVPALMTVYRNEGRWDGSNVLFDGSRVMRYDKRSPTADMHFIDYGLNILTSGVLRPHAAGKVFDLGDVFAELSAQRRLAGYEVKRRFYEVGTPQGLAETEAYLRGDS